MIYSKKLGAYEATATGVYDLFTAASDVTTVIRSIQGVSADPSSSLNGLLLINGLGFWGTGAVAYLQAYSEEMRLVLDPGDVVSFYVVAGYGAMYVSGYELS